MSEDTNTKETIAILGGTGDLGTGLAIRWSKAGHKIVIGSRTLEKAEAAVKALQEISPETPAEAMENGNAAKAGEIRQRAPEEALKIRRRADAAAPPRAKRALRSARHTGLGFGRPDLALGLGFGLWWLEGRG